MTPAPIIPIKVVIVFYSRYGNTEKAALAAGVGAIQGRALIRLRRLADLTDEETIARDPRWTTERERMNRDYIAPRPIDAEWADVIFVASPKDRPEEMAGYLAGLADLSTKAAALPDSAPDPIAAARAFGKQVTEAARQRKA
jgi:hypothetical protein